MLHRATLLLHSIVGKPLEIGRAESTFLTASQAVPLSLALAEDGKDYLYSAGVSLLDAVRGLSAGFYTWATVKCYYSVFYSLRALLASDGIAVVYVNKSPMILFTRAGQSPVRSEGNTHKVVLECFAKHKSSHYLLSQQIEAKPPLRWLMEHREHCNYKLPRFCEPESPEHFQQVQKHGVRQVLAAYTAPGGDVYTFDKDHAMLAYPRAAFIFAADALAKLGAIEIDQDQQDFVADNCRDKQGKLLVMISILQRAYSNLK